MPEETDQPKIIIDEDWKSQVEREREAAQQEAVQQETAKQEAEKPSAAEADFEMPEASFPLMVTMLATQAMLALGQMPNPITEKIEVSKPQAKHFIDLLAMLEDKTQGNLSGEETAMISNILHQLRMAFVAPPEGETADGETAPAP